MPKGVTGKVVDKMAHAYYFILTRGCATTAEVANQLGVGRSNAVYVLRMLLREGYVVEAVIGGVALWCRDRESAEQFIKHLKSEVVRVVGARKFISPKELLLLISKDKRARKTFSNIIRIDKPAPLTYNVLATLLESIYGEPVGRWKYFTLQPDMSTNITVKNGKKNTNIKERESDTKTVAVSFHIPQQMLQGLDEYARKTGMTRSQVVATAIAKMLEELRRLLHR